LYKRIAKYKNIVDWIIPVQQTANPTLILTGGNDRIHHITGKDKNYRNKTRIVVNSKKCLLNIKKF